MVSSGKLRRVALVRTDGSEELSASFIGVTRIGVYEQHSLYLATDARCEELAFLLSVRRLLVAASVVPSPRFLSP
jgi:hypothetical protein